MTTPLQDFVVDVVAEDIGTDIPSLAGAVQRYEEGTVGSGEELVGIDISMIIMLIETLMPMIMDMIDNCNANQTRVTRAIQNPGLFQRVSFRRQVNRAIRNGEPRWRSESHELATIMMRKAAEATPESVGAVIDQCRNSQMGDLA